MSNKQPLPSDHEASSSTRSLLRSPWVWAFFIGIVIVTAMRPLLVRKPPPPPVLWSIPPFTLTDQQGQAFGSQDLAGNVYVANFFFTSCPTICPGLMQAMSELQQRLAEHGIDHVRLISITVDPETDTPERLGEYAVGIGVDPRRWRLLTGDAPTIRDLLLDGFKVPLGDPDAPEGQPYNIAHSGKFVIVDPQGGMRGYYDLDTRHGLDEVFHRSRHVLEEAK